MKLVLTVRKRDLIVRSGKVGVISDTHGLVRAEAMTALKGCEIILHAGDIGKPEVLDSLETIAPVIAIRGNNDRGSWAKKLPDILNLRINGLGIYVIHNVHELESSPGDDFRLVVSGHSHQPSAITRGGVLYLNPGSAGPRRFKLPVAVARLQVRGKRVRAKIIEIKA
ncbi:MAG TPA: metallophosphoesterase family protein [Candidatus Binatia bacterium]